MKQEQVHELLYEALETELGGVQIYEAALRCARNDELRTEWEKYHDETTRHCEIVRGVFEVFGLDPEAETPGRLVVRHIGESLVAAMDIALSSGPPEAAELVATECMTLAETKDHLNWELMGEVAGNLTGDRATTLMNACKEVEDQEDEHLYHTTGWSRELWMDSLGLPAVLPPPEEQKHVKTAIGASRARQQRDDMP